METESSCGFCTNRFVLHNANGRTEYEPLVAINDHGRPLAWQRSPHADIQVTNLDVKSSDSYPAHTSAHQSPCRNKRNSTIGTLEIGPRPTLFLAKVVGEWDPGAFQSCGSFHNIRQLEIEFAFTSPCYYNCAVCGWNAPQPAPKSSK
jgi:hypothetical protein